MEFSFVEILILLLIGLLFGKDTLLPWVAERLGIEVKNGQPDWAQRLEKHHNHETSEQNTNVLNALGRIETGQEQMCKKLDKVTEKLDDIRVYGVRVRNGK